MSGMRTHISDLEKRPEIKADEIEVQHLLVAHKGSGIGGVTRSLEEAEKLAGKLLTEIEAGGNFDSLVKQHTNDAHPGIYGMTMKGGGDRAKNVYPRKGMVAAFGDVGWRLQVGEVGVAPFHAQKSPYGFHIIKRLK